METQVILALGIGIAAVAEDLWHRQISNWTSLAALTGGLGLHLYEKGAQGIVTAFGSALAGFGVFLAFYLLGGMGGGDIKLMAGFGAVLGKPSILIDAALYAAAIGGLMAVLVLLTRVILSLIRSNKAKAKAADLGSTDSAAAEKRASIPYAPAITLGVWLALIGNF